jgi:D-alanyl-D-alanine carboxypeptidase
LCPKIYMTINQNRDLKMYKQLSLSELDQTLNILVNRGFVPSIAYSLIDQHRVIHQNVIGFSTIHTKIPTKIKPTSHFRIASVSKLVVCLAVLKMIESKEIDINEDVNAYLDFKLINPKFKDHKITVKHLLTHMSSIIDGENERYTAPNDYNLQDFFKLNKKKENADFYYDEGSHIDLKHAPGTYFKYANLNFGILATIMEKIRNQRFDIIMQEIIFNPLGLSASFNVMEFDDETRKSHATLYRKQKGNDWSHKFEWQIQADKFLENNGKPHESKPLFEAQNYVIGQNATILSPQGGLRININDLTKLSLLLAQKGEIDGAVFINPETFDLLTKTHWKYDAALKNGDTLDQLITSFGLSNIQFSYQEDSPFRDEREDWFGHSGEAYGLFSGIYSSSKRQQAICFMINGLGVQPEITPPSGFYQIEKYILNALFDALKTYQDRDI